MGSVAYRHAGPALVRGLQSRAVLLVALRGRHFMGLSGGASQRDFEQAAKRYIRIAARSHSDLRHRRRNMGVVTFLYAVCLLVRHRADATDGPRAGGCRAGAWGGLLDDVAPRHDSLAAA